MWEAYLALEKAEQRGAPRLQSRGALPAPRLGRLLDAERSLRFTIAANHVALDKLYNCDVIASIANAVDYLCAQQAS